MGGLFGVASKVDCAFDLFFGVDYHSHLGTRYGGMAVYGENGFDKAIHNIENSPFRTKFERDIHDLKGTLGIGCISDSDPQPLIVHSHLGTFALTTVGRINNSKELIAMLMGGTMHFSAISHGEISPTEIVAALINQRASIVEGIQYAQEKIEGSLSMLMLTDHGIYASRDKFGRTPLVLGRKIDSYCVSFENFAYHNLGYGELRELGPGEIVLLTPDGVQTLSPPRDQMKICAFLWVYYGYPTSSYEGINVETMRYNSGALLAEHDDVVVDAVAGVPDSGTPHAIGYANRSAMPFARPFIKYTPTWPRSFMPVLQSKRDLIAKMKLIPVDSLIAGKKLLLVEDSIVRGTQMRETTEFLYGSGAKEVHIRTACPPLLFGCKYVNFSRAKSEMELITRRTIAKLEGDKAGERLPLYIDENTDEHRLMVEEIRKELNFSSLGFQKLSDMIAAIGIDKCKVCTYCWNGVE